MHKAVIFNGPPGSGKDTAASLFQTTLRKRCIGSIRMSIAQPMKDAVHKFYGIKYSKAALEKLKDTPLEGLNGNTLREEYIAFSEQFIKPRMGIDFFGKQFVEKLKKRDNAGIFLITDCGFQEEYEVIQEYLGKENLMVIQMLRNGKNFKYDSREYIDSNGSLHLPVFNHKDVKSLTCSIRSAVEDQFLKKILTTV